MSCCGGGDAGSFAGTRNVGEWRAIAGSAALVNFGWPAPATAGTATIRNVSAAAGPLEASKRAAVVSAAAVSSVAGWRTASRQFAIGLAAPGAGRFKGSGFRLLFQFAITDAVLNGEAAMFLGADAAVAAPAAVTDPATRPNIFGVGCALGDGNLHVLLTNGVGGVHRVDLGNGFPVRQIGNNAFYRVQLEVPAGQTGALITYRWRVMNIATGADVAGEVASGDGPSGGVECAFQAWRCTGPVDAAAVALDMNFLRCMTEL